jgi:hypothetical protein
VARGQDPSPHWASALSKATRAAERLPEHLDRLLLHSRILIERVVLGPRKSKAIAAQRRDGLIEARAMLERILAKEPTNREARELLDATSARR